MSKAIRYVFAGGLALFLAVAARAQLTNYTTIDYPGSTAGNIIGINDAGDMVGGYFTSDGRRHGYLLKHGKFTTIDFPDMPYSTATGINAAGDIVGFYQDASGIDYGFLLRGGRFTTIQVPGFERTRAFTINAKGEIVGMYWNTSGDTMRRGFLLSGGRFTEICYPEATMTMAFGINDHGEITGRWVDAAGKGRGFRWRQGRFSSFEFPGGRDTAGDLVRITNSGDIAGPYTDARGKTKGFLLSGGRYTSIDVAGSTRTRVLDINAAGQIVGDHSDAARAHGLLTAVAPAFASPPLLVDDDGADCPGGLPTIQEAVRAAAPGATILVCRGIYTGTVSLTGPQHNSLKLIALGRTNEVILQGEYSARDGFHLKQVSNVLIRGFTVRDFGTKATTATEWGVGHLIYLENAHYNTIEQNQLLNADRAGILLVDSGNNVIRNNAAFADNAGLATSGIEVQGAKSANNLLSLNLTYGNNVAGIMLAGAGPGNVIRDNTVLANGRFGIDVQDTSEVWIEGNRVSYSRGFWGTTPGGKEAGVGIHLANLLKATVFDNRARNNTGMDLIWDGKGDNRVESNACDTCAPAGACGK